MTKSRAHTELLDSVDDWLATAERDGVDLEDGVVIKLWLLNDGEWTTRSATHTGPKSEAQPPPDEARSAD